MSAEHEVVALSRGKWEWMSAKDVDRLSDLFLDDAVFVHMGATFSASEELEVISSGSIHYRDVTIHDVSTHDFGSTVVLVTRLDMVAVVGGVEVPNPFAVTETYIALAGVWRLAAMSFTKLLTPA